MTPQRVNPVFVSSGTPGPRQVGAAFAKVTLVIVLLIMSSSFILVRFTDAEVERDGLRGHDQVEGERELKTDGVSSLPEDAAVVAYSPVPNQFETIEPVTGKDIRGGSVWRLTSWGSTRSYVAISHVVLRRPLVDERAVDRFLTYKESLDSFIARQDITYSTVSVDGRVAYRGDYADHHGSSVFNVWILGRVHAYQFKCVVEPTNRFAERLRAQCKGMLKSLRINL